MAENNFRDAGYRHLELLSNSGKSLFPASLLVHIRFDKLLEDEDADEDGEDSEET